MDSAASQPTTNILPLPAPRPKCRRQRPQPWDWRRDADFLKPDDLILQLAREARDCAWNQDAPSRHEGILRGILGCHANGLAGIAVQMAALDRFDPRECGQEHYDQLREMVWESIRDVLVQLAHPEIVDHWTERGCAAGDDAVEADTLGRIRAAALVMPAPSLAEAAD